MQSLLYFCNYLLTFCFHRVLSLTLSFRTLISPVSAMICDTCAEGAFHVSDSNNISCIC